MGIKNHIIVHLLPALLLVVTAFPATAQDASGTGVALVTAQAATAGGRFEIDGSVQAVRQATLSAQVGGSVLALQVKAGDRVKAGQAVARIDAREAEAGMLKSEAALSQAEAEARNARTHVERTRELRQQGFVSQAALDVADTQFKAAQAGVQQAVAGRNQSALARGHSLVSAPFDGIVLATHLEAGDLAMPGRPIATVYAPGALRVVVPVGVSRAAAARSATRIEIELPDGRRVAPSQRTELATTDPVSQTIEWRLDLPAASLAGVTPGQTVRVRFEAPASAGTPASSSSGALRLPQAAVLRRGELTAVYVAQGEAFALRFVRLGADRGADGVEVLAGLRADERVAANALQAGLAGARPAR